MNDEGLAVRRSVLGSEYVDRALERQDALTAEFQEFVTDYCWGLIWTDERLSRRERSLLTLGMTAGLGRFSEFQTHVLGATRNGISAEELSAILKQIAVYCGVPTAVSCAGAMRETLDGVGAADANGNVDGAEMQVRSKGGEA